MECWVLHADNAQSFAFVEAKKKDIKDNCRDSSVKTILEFFFLDHPVSPGFHSGDYCSQNA